MIKSFLKKHFNDIFLFLLGFLVSILLMLCVFNEDIKTGQKINSLLTVIDTYYYEDIDKEELKDNLYNGLCTTLDVYTNYYSEKDYNDLIVSQNSYAGIGCYTKYNDELQQTIFTYIYEDTPAEKAGLKIGDVLIEIDDTPIKQLDKYPDLSEYIRGEEGTNIKLTVLRENELLEFNIVRQEINTPSLNYELLTDNIGYIEFWRFNDNSCTEMKNALQYMNENNIEHVIIDLRGNTGGQTQALVDVSSLFLDNKLLCTQEDKNGNVVEIYSNENQTMNYDFDIICLTNVLTASCSEVLVSDFQYYDIATIVGTTTLGKGCSQQYMQFEDGSALTITVNEWYTPDHRNINDLGIYPDIYQKYIYTAKDNYGAEKDKDSQILKAIEIFESE